MWQLYSPHVSTSAYMKIVATTYTREDGLLLLRVYSGDRWVIRRVGFGGPWFYAYNHDTGQGEWTSCALGTFRVALHGLEFALAWHLFEHLPCAA
jgi:hypothetical protein